MKSFLMLGSNGAAGSFVPYMYNQFTYLSMLLDFIVRSLISAMRDLKLSM